MEIKNKDWLDILGRNSDYHGDPLIILDESFEIIFTNQKAISLFLIDDYNISLEQIFEKTTVQEILDFVGPAINTFQKKILKNISIDLKSGHNLLFDLSIDPIRTEDVLNVILVFRSIDNINKDDLLSKIKITKLDNGYSEFKQEINSLVSGLKSFAPFTIISIKQVKNLIDKYEFPIWIKDIEGKLYGINNSYANTLGIEASFAMGKKHETFLPPYQNSIIKVLDQYVLLNAHHIILEGFSNKNKNFEVIRNIIQIPLLSNFNKIIAIIGLIVDNKYDYYNIWGKKEFFSRLINSFSEPAALLNSYGKMSAVNEKLIEFFKFQSNQILDIKINEIFSSEVTKKIDSFIQSDLEETTLELTDEPAFIDSSEPEVRLKLLKIPDLEKHKSNILLIIESENGTKKYGDELQNILMHRGTMFEILIQKNPEPIFVYDKENLKFLEVNKAAINLYGYGREEFLKMDLTDLYAPEDIQTLLDSFGDETSEARFSKPFRHRKKDGSVVLVEISKTSFKFNEREAHFNIIKDITDSIEKDKQFQMLRTISNESDLLIFNTDSSGFITSLNLNVTKNLGYTIDGLRKSSFASIVSDDERGIVNTSVFQSNLKDTVQLESKIKDAMGNQFDAEIYATPILDFDGEIDSFTIIIKPLKGKSVSDSPKEIVKEVIKEVIVEKKESAQQKFILPDSNFLSGMFHEILTPIYVIIGFAQELISSTENPTEEQLEASEIINQNRIKMMNTMNAVIEFSDIMQNRSPLKVEDITITDIIVKLDENIQDSTGINDIQFAYGKISSSLKFKSDRQKFENFILSIIKVVSQLSKDKKVYFSAFSVDAESFIIGISDQYGNPSEYVANVLEQVFTNDRDPKDFGLPKLTTYLAKILLKYLDGKFYRSSSDTNKNETGFIFPIVFSSRSENKIYESVQEVISSTPPSDEFDDRNLISTTKPSLEQSDRTKESSEEIVDQNLEDKDTRDYAKDITSEEPDDIFKPVQPIAQEILSKLDDEKLIEDDSIQKEIETYDMLDQDRSEELVETDSGQNESEVQEDLTDRIAEEIESDIDKNIEVQPPQSLDLSKLFCLYIEDQVDSQILFKVQMKELHDIKFAVSFEDAQILMNKHQFDFIVMDINLQGEYNGLDALKIIKTMPAFSSIPIIAVTAYVLPGDKEKFIAAGFDDFISKPIFKEKMMESLEKIFLSKN
ncbi:MAG: PAS domain S-box protein [Ignavibacterium sp.]|jgi:PAS domain S-box-containing protein|nr:PAS domain S-box protein [Ignavibacterium sp.]